MKKKTVQLSFNCCNLIILFIGEHTQGIVEEWFSVVVVTVLILLPYVSYSFGSILCIFVLFLEQCRQILLSGTQPFSMMLPQTKNCNVGRVKWCH